MRDRQSSSWLKYINFTYSYNIEIHSRLIVISFSCLINSWPRNISCSDKCHQTGSAVFAFRYYSHFSQRGKFRKQGCNRCSFAHLRKVCSVACHYVHTSMVTNYPMNFRWKVHSKSPWQVFHQSVGSLTDRYKCIFALRLTTWTNVLVITCLALLCFSRLTPLPSVLTGFLDRVFM